MGHPPKPATSTQCSVTPASHSRFDVDQIRLATVVAIDKSATARIQPSDVTFDRPGRREAAGGHRLLFTLSRCNKYAANYHIGSLLELHPPKCVTIKKRLRGDGERNDRCGLCRNRRFDRYDWLVDLGRRSRKAVQVIAPFYRPQSSSASRFTAGAFGFLILIQCLERPDR